MKHKRIAPNKLSQYGINGRFMDDLVHIVKPTKGFVLGHEPNPRVIDANIEPEFEKLSKDYQLRTREGEMDVTFVRWDAHFHRLTWKERLSGVVVSRQDATSGKYFVGKTEWDNYSAESCKQLEALVKAEPATPEEK